MAKYTNESGGLLVLHDDTKIPVGESCEISGDMAKNAGVAGWIKNKSLVLVKGK